MRPMFFALAERWLIEKLLRSPQFHRGVGFVHKRIHQFRHGVPPEELGGTKIDDKKRSLVSHFVEELQNQIKGIPPKR